MPWIQHEEEKNAYIFPMGDLGNIVILLRLDGEGAYVTWEGLDGGTVYPFGPVKGGLAAAKAYIYAELSSLEAALGKAIPELLSGGEGDAV